LEENDKVVLFEKCIPYLSIYEKYTVVNESKSLKELELVKKKLESIENYVFSTRQPMLEKFVRNSYRQFA